MMKCSQRPLAAVLLSLALWVNPIHAQERNGTLTGTVTSSGQNVLSGALVELQTKAQSAVSDVHGHFTISGLAPGQYTLKASYLGFTPFQTTVTVITGKATSVNPVLKVEMRKEQMVVSADRQLGEVEAINRERTADNILQVLPSEVITSLPNTNIADAVGRLPSVSLERDEGEGKYIQIRGTEPRLSNVTINGIHLPSPENVRNVKLDVIPSDLVDSIEVSKTLSADQDADAIGGSVNLVTKSAIDRPYVSVLGMGGYTPIAGGRSLHQFDGTVGDRFGGQKRLGVIFGASYDYNARGIDDVEPAPTTNTLLDGSTFLGPNTADLREYHYNRSRYGFTGGIDYKLADMSSIYLRGLFSRFRDYGEDWIYSPGIDFTVDPTTCGLASQAGPNGPQGCGNISFTNVYRKPIQQIFGVQAGARHVFGTMLLTYEIALSQAKSTGGYPRASFDGPGTSDNSVAFGVNTSQPFTPKFPVLNGVNIYDPTAYSLSGLSFQNNSTFERDVVGDISLNKQYSAGSHYGSFEIGFKTWDARKTQNFDEQSWGLSATAPNLPMNQFLSSFTNPNYYLGGRYTLGPVTDYNKILAYFNTNPSQFSGGFDPVNSIPNDFDDSERIYAGYVMNTISFGRLRLQTGLRVESTRDSLLGNVVNLSPVDESFVSSSPLSARNSYTDLFPSIQAQYRFTPDTVMRASYGMGIARPNFYDMSPYLVNDPFGSPNVPISAGNPALKPTHGQNVDLLMEHYLKPVGIIQVGAFYKYLTDPIYNVSIARTTAPFAGLLENTLVNGPRAHVSGIELSWQQRLSFMPGLLNGMGVRGNYSYTTSRASFPVAYGRTDHPSLIRQAPNNWNFDVTYDKKGISARMGLTHNDAYIWSYAGGNATPTPDGDTYLYPHTQVDAQVSYAIPHGHGLSALASFLNLNNEVFGFYNGAERFPIQREYYNRTYSFGLRWTLQAEPR